MAKVRGRGRRRKENIDGGPNGGKQKKGGGHMSGATWVGGGKGHRTVGIASGLAHRQTKRLNRLTGSYNIWHGKKREVGKKNWHKVVITGRCT